MSEWSHGVAWSKDLETGNDAIDSQHKELFRLTSNLVEACEGNKGQDVVDDTLKFLASYTELHFADEEALQLAYNFPEYERHKKIHDDFKVQVGELMRQHMADAEPAKLSAKLNSAVIQWLLRHVKGEDFKIAAHIRKVASGEQP